jgi:hypothetical protein
MKIQGFNAKEQRVFNRMRDGEPHDFAELKTLFREEAKVRCKETYKPGWGEFEIDTQAQSYARNSIRRLINDGWVEQTGRGTYRLTKTGRNRVVQGVTTTPSLPTRKPRRPDRTHRHRAPKTPKKTKPRSMTTKTDSAKVKALKTKVTKEALTAKLTTKAKKTANRADSESGHKAMRARMEKSIEERLAEALH